MTNEIEKSNSFSFTTKITIKMKKIYSATIFFPAGSFRPRKYRNIHNKLSFIRFAEKSGGIYINFYDKESGNFLFQHKIEK